MEKKKPTLLSVSVFCALSALALGVAYAFLPIFWNGFIDVYKAANQPVFFAENKPIPHPSDFDPNALDKYRMPEPKLSK